jgi:hypothetical protein
MGTPSVLFRPFNVVELLFSVTLLFGGAHARRGGRRHARGGGHGVPAHQRTDRERGGAVVFPPVSLRRKASILPQPSRGDPDQGVTLVHFSAQPESFLTLNTSLKRLNIPSIPPLNTP